jgi:hypothetical protein
LSAELGLVWICRLLDSLIVVVVIDRRGKRKMCFHHQVLSEKYLHVRLHAHLKL